MSSPRIGAYWNPSQKLTTRGRPIMGNNTDHQMRIPSPFAKPVTISVMVSSQSDSAVPDVFGLRVFEESNIAFSFDQRGAGIADGPCLEMTQSPIRST